MYDDYYNFELMPFENTPDPRFFYASEQHREALAAIEYTIRMRKGFVLITGEIGAGKTTVGRTMCQRCGDSAQIVHVQHGHRTGEGVIRQILRAMDLPAPAGEDRSLLLDRLRDYLMARLQDNYPVVFFVDEAQTLSDEALEELRLLSNFDTCTRKPVQVALVGQPELRQRVGRPHMAALRQRIVMAKHLRPLDRDDTEAYIIHRLRAASRDADDPAVIFDQEAVQAIHRYSQGVPRLINVVADNALLVGYVRQADTITGRIIQQVLDDMVPALADEPTIAVCGAIDDPRESALAA